MPPESPYLYGLHPNAEIGFLTTTSENLFRTVFEMQPRDAGASGGATVTPEEKVNIILKKLVLKILDKNYYFDSMNLLFQRVLVTHDYLKPSYLAKYCCVNPCHDINFLLLYILKIN